LSTSRKFSLKLYLEPKNEKKRSYSPQRENKVDLDEKRPIILLKGRTTT
jgi:hypothetical protein